MILRHVYAEKAISQIPRLLTLQDRNPYSPTYGCFHRDYWLYKTSDFPDAVRQFGTQALALVYKHDFPGNIYKGHPKVRDWTLAAMDYWTSIQHADGSFDEFYPYERGWVGPSAFTTFAICESFELMKDEVPPALRKRIVSAIDRAARFIVAGDKEEDHLANHHAMACLAVWRAGHILGDESLKPGFEKLFQGFLKYHNQAEGWSREYDGVDPGYLSATVSFFGKVHRTNPDPRILEVLKQSVDFCSYFVYPNGFYAGSMGSRNTLHFYPHGFEILAAEYPPAAAVADRMLEALADNKLVPPEIMSDRYLFYRVPEFLQAYLDYSQRPATLPALPFEAETSRYFPGARVSVLARGRHYMIANLAKGGVVKVFNRRTGELLMNDCGWIGKLSNGRVFTSQWVDPQFECKADESGWEVTGTMHLVPSNKLFTPFKSLVFRSVLVATGWVPAFAHAIKGFIRKSMMLGRRPVPVSFRRRLSVADGVLTVSNQLWLSGRADIRALSGGDEFFVRYVPQSRFFQTQELAVEGYSLTPVQLEALNRGETITIEKRLNLDAAAQGVIH